MIKTIVFDIGMVLLGFDWPAYMKKIFADDGIAEKVTHAVFGGDYWKELDRGVLSEEEIMQECGRCLRCDVYGCGALEGGRIQYA